MRKKVLVFHWTYSPPEYEILQDFEIIKYQDKFVGTIEVSKIYNGEAELDYDKVFGYINDDRLIYDEDFYDYSPEITREMLFRNNLEQVIKDKACNNNLSEPYMVSIVNIKM